MAEEPTGERHWSDELPFQLSPADMRKLEKAFTELSEAKERVDGIVFMCSLDEHLERLLRTVMIEDKSVDKLMNDGQALQSFSSKLKLAYALGLISEGVRKDLDYLNKIRNEFAHNADVTSFDQAPVRDWCANLSTVNVKGPDGEVQPPREAHRMAAFETWMYLYWEVMRRGMEKKSRQAPPANTGESMFMLQRARLKGSVSKKQGNTILTGDIPAHTEEDPQAGG